MGKAAGAVAALAALAAFGQELQVSRNALWVDTVKQGNMPIMVRGLGVLGANSTADLKIAESQAKGINPGQAATIDTRQGIINGKVARIGPEVVNGTVTVVVALQGPLPEAARPGMDVDGTVQVENLTDVSFVGRPVRGQAFTDDTLFKLEPDGQHATRVKVRYGRASVNQMQIVSGLQPGDRVILSDTSAYEGQNRLRLQ